MHQAFLMDFARRSRKPGHADGNVGIGAGEGAFRHRPRNDFRDSIIVVEQITRDTEQVALRFLRVGHKAAIEAVSRSFDVGQQSGQHSTRAALGRGDCQLRVAQAVHQPLGLLVQMIWKSRLERLAQPRSPGVAAGRSLAD